MRIAAGELDRRIEIWRSGMTDDGTAKVPGEPVRIATPWARKLDVSDGERIRAAQQNTEITTRFLVRSTPITRDLTGGEIVVCRGKRYEVTGAKESAERDDGVEISTVSRPDLLQ